MPGHQAAWSRAAVATTATGAAVAASRTLDSAERMASEAAAATAWRMGPSVAGWACPCSASQAGSPEPAACLVLTSACPVPGSECGPAQRTCRWPSAGSPGTSGTGSRC